MGRCGAGLGASRRELGIYPVTAAMRPRNAGGDGGGRGGIEEKGIETLKGT